MQLVFRIRLTCEMQAVAVIAMLVLLLSNFPEQGSKMVEEEEEEEEEDDDADVQTAVAEEAEQEDLAPSERGHE